MININGGIQMRKILLLLVTSALIVGCSSNRKKQDASQGAGGVQSESIDNAPMGFDPQGSDSGKIAGLSTIQFDYDKSAIKPSEKAKLEANAAWIKSRPNVKVQIEGHCDQKGSIEYNLSLGERRANAVKAALVKMGVKADQLSTISYGKEKLLTTDESEAAMMKNRRANFVPAAQ